MLHIGQTNFITNATGVSTQYLKVDQVNLVPVIHYRFSRWYS